MADESTIISYTPLLQEDDFTASALKRLERTISTHFFPTQFRCERNVSLAEWNQKRMIGKNNMHRDLFHSL